MPPKPQWFLRVPQIRDELAALDTPVVDRATVERTFGLRRRRAIELMHAFAGYLAGRMLLIERRALLARLDAMIAGDEFVYERRRMERLAAKLDELRRARAAARVVIRTDRSAVNRKTADLPAGIRIAPGRLTVDFADAEDLLSSLLDLARAAANDFEEFRRMAEPAGTAKRPLAGF